MVELSRREMAAALAIAPAALPGRAWAAPREQAFPKDFVWGCATAAYQIEGAVNEDGRGLTNWDVFSHTPGKTANGDTGDVSCDSYHRFREDRQLLQGVGARAYRMSLAWARIFPDGRGKPNPNGLDHYQRLIDDLLANGIEPYVTLFHWDLPQALPGGWQSRDTAYAFADYAGFVADKLSDRVRRFITTNELRCFTDLGHQIGKHAPGLRLPRAEVNQVRHHGVLAHGLAVQAVRAHARAGTQVGIAENPIVPVPVIETPEHIAAAKTAMRQLNAPFLTALAEGRYTQEYLTAEGAAAPKVQDGDMRAIGSALDFIALNIYAPDYVRAADTPAGFEMVADPKSYPKMSLPWLKVGPEVAYWGLRLVSELWRPKALYISENGAASADQLVGGRVDDTDRLMFLRNYIGQARRAVADGYPLKGYFLWSLLDNFEWSDGYGKRFGIHYVDFATQQRTPKLSAAWYREVIRRNAVV